MLVEVMLHVMNLVLRCEFSLADWKRRLLEPLHKDVTIRKFEIIEGLP